MAYRFMDHADDLQWNRFVLGLSEWKFAENPR